MRVMLDECLESFEYINMVAETEEEKEAFSSMELSDKLEKYLPGESLFDYPLSELGDLCEEDINLVLVRFKTEVPGIWEYRLCEVF